MFKNTESAQLRPVPCADVILQPEGVREGSVALLAPVVLDPEVHRPHVPLQVAPVCRLVVAALTAVPDAPVTQSCQSLVIEKCQNLF